MKGLPFLLEIGAEEIPDWMIEPALANLRDLFAGLLADRKLGGSVTAVDATPRRLVLRAEGIAKKQADSSELVMGPPVSAAFKDGQPTGAAQGFARKMGVEVEALKRENTPRGEYLAFVKKTPGREAIDILAEALPEAILKIYFPKTMYWTGKSGARFIRPIRWLVALLGTKVVPFEIAGVASSNVTAGHRRLGKAKVKVSIANFDAKLRENGVVVAAAERRAAIEAGIAALLEGKDLRVRADAALLDTLTYLTECPQPILGSFDAKYLELPEEVLVTVMRHHQKYFSVEDANGKLAPHFIAVMNTSGDADGLVRRGNERVLRARFNDARFFWDVDQQKPLRDRVADLKNVTFQAKLGSYKDKTDRVVALVGQLGGSEEAQRAALLAKCDLTCEMVKEFTELQGVVGGLYARAQGEPEAVAKAVYEHYKPVSMEDTVPSTIEGRVVAIADKLDTLRECFRIGMIPSGSKDPFALRRAAQGVVKILVEGKFPLQLDEEPQLADFLVDRIKYYFREIRGFRYDEVNAVLAAGRADLPDAEARLEALKAVRPTEDFEPLAASFKRIRNILVQAGSEAAGEIDAALLEPGPEAELHAAFTRVVEPVRAAKASGDYGAALETIASLRPHVDLFFDKVLVNAPDVSVRRNRLALLHHLLTEFSAIADFSEIVVTASS